MERGDLAISIRPHYVVVLEGVLCQVTDRTTERMWRRPKVTGHNLNWLDLPLRRFATLQRRFPEVGAAIVTFTDEETADMAAEFLDQAGISFDELSYQPFDTWVSLLPYRWGLQTIYDSDPDRLDRYGQLGRAVIRGEDFQ